MREDNHDIQTPKKENSPYPSNRKAKQMNAMSKKPNHQQQKSAKKNLSSVLNSITEDDVGLKVPEKESIEISESVDADQSTLAIGKTSLNSDHTLVSDNDLALQHPEESVEISPISEVSDFNENIESYIMSLNQFASPSSVTTSTVQATPLSCVTSVQTTPFSSPISSAQAAAVNVSSATGDEDSSKLEPLVKHLRESLFQVLNSADIDPKCKKFLDALVKMVIQVVCSLHEEREMVVEVFSRKIKILLLSFVVFIVAGLVLFLDRHSSYHGSPPPT